ncbi:uracil permease [Penicillium rubens]|nr:uracil permease [Penicillium rubens]
MTKLKWILDKAAVENEPGLTNAQMMLTNNDLRPVDPERRQWKWINFIAFWIADSLNIVSVSKWCPVQAERHLTQNTEHLDDFLINDR